MLLPFTPAGAVTGIGSLPFTSVAEAIDSIAELSPEIPFWPQLPMMSKQEGIIDQGLGLLGDLIEARAEGYGYEVKHGCIDAVVAMLHRSTGALQPSHAAGFFAFEEAVFPLAVAVKAQVEGPITLAAYLFYRGRPFLADASLFAAVAFHISQIICWQIDRLKAAGLPVMLFVDEPALCLEGSEEKRLSALGAMLDDVRRRGALAGLHCCAARPFARMCRVAPDILSFDAHEGLELFFADTDAREFVQRGGMVAYGLVPTRSSLADVDAKSLFIRWLQAATLAGDPQELARQAMITATCGLGLLSPAAARESFTVANEVGEMIRELAR